MEEKLKRLQKVQKYAVAGATIIIVALLYAGWAVIIDRPADTTTRAAGLPPPPSGKVWNQVWADEFNDSTVDTSKWNVQNSSNYGSGNHEDACYMANNVSEAGGFLRLTAQKQTVSCGGTNPDLGNSTYYFTSGMVTTRAQGGSLKYKYTQGYIEARIKAPKGNPYWPAFWLVGPSDGSTPGWPDYGEFDVMEIYGSRPDATTSTLHYKCNSTSAHCKSSPDVYNIKTDSAYGGNATYGTQVNDQATFDAYTGATTAFNTYGFLWDADRITFYVNGRRVRYIDSNGVYRIEQNGSVTLENTINSLGAPSIPFSTVFSYAHSIILNLAVGGNGPRHSTFGYTGYDTTNGYVNGNLVATLPDSMQVDYIRVYQLANAPTPPPSDTTAPTVTLTSPTNGQTVAGTVAMGASVTDNVGVTRVTFAVDGSTIKDDTNAADGWSASWNTGTISNGTHVVKAVAYDAAGNSKETTVSVVVNNPSAPSIGSFTANPSIVASGGTSSLSWSTSNTTGCSVTPGGPVNTAATSWQTGPLNATATFTLTCSGTSGSVTKTVAVSVAPSPSITSFTANPQTVVVGGNTTLNWITANTVSCSITPSGPTDTTATSWQTLGLLNIGDKVYTLTCKNSVGAITSATTTVSVQPAPTPPTAVALSASVTTVVSGGFATLSWTSSGSTSCALNPGGFTASGSSSSKLILNLQTTTTYKVTCSNNAGSTDSNAVTVTVTSSGTPLPAPTITSFVANPTSVAYRGTTTLSWATSNVAPNGCNLAPSPLSSASGSGQWTTPRLTASTSYTLTCKNAENIITSKSLSVTVDNKQAGKPPKPVSAKTIAAVNSAETTVLSTTGEEVVNTQVSDEAEQGSLITLESSAVTDDKTVALIERVEFYGDDKLVQTVTSSPFALDTSVLSVGTYNITQRTYFKDGSTSQKSQIVTIAAKKAVETQPISGKALIAIVVVIILLGGVAFAVRYVMRRRLTAKMAQESAAKESVVIRPRDPRDPSGQV